MRVSPKSLRVLAALLALTAGTGCEDELPTVTGDDRFPFGDRPTTLELIVPAAEFLFGDTVFRGYVEPKDAPYLLVAEHFDGVLDAHALARLTDFPDTISFSAQTDSTFTYGAATVETVVDGGSSTTTGPVRLRLWSLEQGWDSSTVSWTEARAGEAWRVPGGTPGELLAETTWTPGDTAQSDTIAWQVDSLAVRRLADGESAGLLVTVGTDGGRVELSRLRLEAAIHPTARPDTTVTRVVSDGPQVFVFSPPPPATAGVWSAGGLTADRTVLSLDLSLTVPTCEGPAADTCPRIPLREVTLNRAILLLQPVPVAGGFRPLGATRVSVRRVVEVELGRRAPLGEIVAVDSVPASAFAPSSLVTVPLDLTQPVIAFAASDTVATTVALLGEPEGGNAGYLWFSDTPRLRLIYTLPMRPRLP